MGAGAGVGARAGAEAGAIAGTRAETGAEAGVGGRGEGTGAMPSPSGCASAWMLVACVRTGPVVTSVAVGRVGAVVAAIDGSDDGGVVVIATVVAGSGADRSGEGEK